MVTKRCVIQLIVERQNYRFFKLSNCLIIELSHLLKLPPFGFEQELAEEEKADQGCDGIEQENVARALAVGEIGCNSGKKKYGDGIEKPVGK